MSISVYQKKWRKDHRQRINEVAREKDRQLRKSVLELLGGKCSRCSFNDFRTLQIDHIKGGGVKEKKERNCNYSVYHKIVMKSFLKGENKYQLLCANCNWIKRYEHKESLGNYEF